MHGYGFDMESVKSNGVGRLFWFSFLTSLNSSYMLGCVNCMFMTYNLLVCVCSTDVVIQQDVNRDQRHFPPRLSRR